MPHQCMDVKAQVAERQKEGDCVNVPTISGHMDAKHAGTPLVHVNGPI